MKKIIYYSLLSVVSLFFMASCANDNYAEPNSGIEGSILDAKTLKPVPQAIETGANVWFKLYEKADSTKTFISFYGKIDGTFKNSWIFSTDYTLSVEQTNFFPVNPMAIRLEAGKITKKDILVMPYLRIDTVIPAISQTIGNDTITSRSLNVTYKMSRDTSYTLTADISKYKINSIAIYWHVSPYIDNAIGNSLGVTTLSTGRKLDGTLLNTDLIQSVDLFKDAAFMKKTNLALIRKNGNKIYIRVCAISNRKANFSEVIPVIVPFIDNELK